MPFATKCLWAEWIKQASLPHLRQHLTATGANMLCIRTESPCVEDLITELHGKHMKVYGWMWPHARPSTADPAKDPAFAPNEMQKIIGLIGKGLDGYVFDIESNENKAPGDWDDTGIANRATVAANMAAGIATAFKARGTPYVLGLTSHQIGFTNYPHIPWQAFLNECNALFPQTYWRADNGSNGVKACDAVSYDYSVHPARPVGTVDQAILNGFKDYANRKDKHGQVLPIIPIGGEIGCSKVGEMTQFGALVAQHGLTEAHFYVDVDKPGWIEGPPQQDDARVLADIKAL